MGYSAVNCGIVKPVNDNEYHQHMLYGFTVVVTLTFPWQFLQYK